MGIWIMVRIHAVQVVKRAPIAIGLRYDITDIIIYAWLKMSFSFSTFLQNSSSSNYIFSFFLQCKALIIFCGEKKKFFFLY